ncbi:MAG: curli-like amyloid fiber formation chaperone CsgH [Hyphomonadaceae bacterium]
MSRLLMSLMALSAAVACSAAARPASDTAAPAAQFATAPAQEARAAQFAEENMRCEVLATRTAGGVRIEAIAHADRASSGEYSLIVRKSGAGGASDVQQGGEFDVADAASALLGVAEFGVERGARVHARLEVRDADGAVCRDEVRL